MNDVWKEGLLEGLSGWGGVRITAAETGNEMRSLTVHLRHRQEP